MDNSDTPKARRPLPTPGVGPSPQQRPSTPVTANPVQRSISPAQFYGKPPPPLPTRPKHVGSGHTTYASSDPPPYVPPASAPAAGFREPELIAEEPNYDDDIPDLIPSTGNDWPATSDWTTNQSGAGSWGDGWVGGGTFDSLDLLSTRRESDVPIDGRNDYEEERWWDPEERTRVGRPGPGMLAPILAEVLHDPHHSLYSVNITGTPQPSSSNGPPPTSQQALSTSTSSEPGGSQSTASILPSDEEVRGAIPHPNAYYCPRENGWVLLIWKTSSIIPPISPSYRGTNPFPDPQKRKRNSCVPEGENGPTPCNKTHHFHRYPKAVDSLRLTSPFREDVWKRSDALKQKRRGQTLVEDVDVLMNDKMEEESLEPEGRLLDLYICCQCHFYCLSSDLIHGVVPRKYMEEFTRDKTNNPAPGKSPELTVTVGAETLLLAIENKIFKGNHRLIKINSSGFQNKLGWNPNIKRIFEFLGFVENTANNDATLMSPSCEPGIGEWNRKKLLRAWVELSGWIAEYKRSHSAAFRDIPQPKSFVQIDNAREMYQRAIGAHPDQIPRGELQNGALDAVRPLEQAWRGLGLTPTSFSWDLLTFAYLAQCRCDPARTPQYFTYLSEIVSALDASGSCPNQLQELVVMERSRNRFTMDEIQRAAQSLGFGSEGILRIDYDDGVEEQFVEQAWESVIKRSRSDYLHGAELQRDANEALRILAEARSSVRLKQLWEKSKSAMSPERAYETLEIPPDTDDNMLIMVFNLRVEDSPSQIDKMREALSVIADVRDSERLRHFLETGQDPGYLAPRTRPDFPRGLDQLGNTCYLNSLLQYFYTIKDLRDAVTPMSALDVKTIEEEKISEEDLNRHRVGGRRVSRKEIIRSKKFINQLANLFFNMQTATTSSVKPSIELAKLALVTSRDEEEDDEAEKAEQEKENNDPKNSVLGKRPRELEKGSSASIMDVDSQDVDDFVMISSPRRATSPPAMSMDISSSPPPLEPVTKEKEKDKDGDVTMKPPARKRSDPLDSGGMMFGKQHDVSECMDNCMFQIEAALLNFASKSDGRPSVVKRLFFGKIRQRLTAAVPSSRASTHDKEDLFSHLPVNVTNEGVDIYDGLSSYFDDIVEYEGRKTRMEVTLVDLPPLLQIQLQRVQFNRETLQPYKSQAYVKFGETIYLDRFMDSADPRKKAESRKIQRELDSCRERIQVLLKGKDGSFQSTLEHTAGYLEALRNNGIAGIEPNLVGELRKEKRGIEDEIDYLRDKIDRLKTDLENLWSTSKEFAYELTSVFIHRGSSPSFGHYFFYSRHLPDQPDEWFKYNDSDVSVVPKDEVLQDTTGSTANPYLLVFARKGSNVVETVNRLDLSEDLT